MKIRLVCSVISLLIAPFLAFLPAVSAQSTYLVSAGAAGPVKIGMTVDEARKSMPNHTFSRTSDGDGVALIAVKEGNSLIFTLYSGEEDAEKPVDYSRVVENIEVWSPAYRTAEGIGPNVTIAEAENKVGKLKEIMISEIEAREFADFENGPKDVSVRVDSGSGIFPDDSNLTKKYRPGSKILSLSISGDGSESNVGFRSEYTDLQTECKTEEPGEEGSHVSTFCEGPDGFRVHMFDTAMTLEINVESPDRSKYVSVASESLNFTTKGKKLEWRYKYGVPFAVILRGNKYKAGDDGPIQYPVEITGEYLFVRGLPGFETINADVNVRTTKFANEEARKIADEGYVRVKFPEKSAFVKLDTADLKGILRDAADKGEAWVKSPMQVAARIAGEFSEMKGRKMVFEAPSSESFDSITFTVVNDGLLDDSVRSEKFVYELVKESNGSWKVSSGKKAWRCWPGRGHEDFSAAPCT